MLFEKAARRKFCGVVALLLLVCKKDDERQDDFLLKNPLLQFEK